MTNQEDLNKLYKKFSFIEEDISKFKEIAFINNAEDFIDAEKNIFEYIGNIIKKDGLVKIFEKSTKKIPFKTAFELFSLIIEETNTTISDEDIEELSNKKEYEKFYSKITRNVKDGDYDIDDLNISNDLLKRVIEVRLDSLETYDLEHLEFGDDDKFITNIFKDYLKTLYQFKVLTREEEKELFEKYKNSEGEERDEIKEKLVNHNLRLVVAIAKKHKPPTLRMDIMDYIQFGNIGLLKALDKYDVEKGNKFSTYATWWIRQSLSRSVADNDTTIRIPVHMFELIKKYNVKINEFVDEYNRIPTDTEIMQLLDIDIEKYKEMKKAARLLDLTSLDMTIDNDGKKDRESTIGSFIEDTNISSTEDTADRGILHDQEEKIMKKVLTEREMKVIKLRFGFDTGEEMTLEKVGKILGVTRERIRQIQAKAIRKLERYGEAAKKAEQASLKELKENKKKEEKLLDRKVEELKKMKTVYELVNEKKEKVDKLIVHLSDEEKRIIEKRNNGEKLTQEEKNKYFGTVNKLRRWIKDETLTESNYKKSIYVMIKEEKEKIDAAIENDLSKNEQRLIQKREKIIAGELDEKLTNAETDRFNALVYKLKVKLGIKKLPKKKTRRKANPQPSGKKRTTIEVLLGKSKEEVDDLIKRLNDDDRRIINDRLAGKKQEKEDLHRYYTIINALRKENVPTGKRRIKNKKEEKITPQQLKEELTLSDEVKDFNENLEAFNEKAKDIIHESELQKEEPVKEVKEQQKQEDESNSIFTNNYKELLSIAMKDPRITREVDIIDLSITCVRYGIGKSEKPRDIDTIAKFYGITTEAVEEISTRVLKELYDVLVDGIIDNNAKQYVKIANQNNKEE